MPKSRVVQAFSAGGVIFRRLLGGGTDATPAAPQAHANQANRDGITITSERIEVALVGYPREGIWTLPKGTPAANETVAETATREVHEETGLEPRILGDLGSIDYWFARKGTRFHKEVFYYLMEATGGDVTQHDHEYDEARWFTLPEALTHLAYVNEKEMMRRAEPLILEYLANGALKDNA